MRVPGAYEERNPILGKHPSVGKVDTYMAISTVGNAVIAYTLPHPYRRYWQVGWIGATGFFVTFNFSEVGGGDWFGK